MLEKLIFATILTFSLYLRVNSMAASQPLSDNHYYNIQLYSQLITGNSK
ncbi:MAG: hypothetical protein WBA13_00345 [Microcoleaceae cyanobacterium]